MLADYDSNGNIVSFGGPFDPTALGMIGNIGPAGYVLAVSADRRRLEWVVAASGGSNSVTLDANADTLLSMTVQQLGLDTQVANRTFVGPASGGAAVPTFRALGHADLAASGGGSTKFLREDMTWSTVPSSGSGLAAHSYYDRLAALLEPDALEPALADTFSYSSGSSSARYLMASYYTRIGSAGRLEVRDPRLPFSLRGLTLVGMASGACAITLNPNLASYGDGRDTYFDRLLALDDATPKILNLTAPSTTYPFLTGAYGAILLRVVNFDFTWIVGLTPAGKGFNLANEIGDGSGDYQRNDNALRLPLSKKVVAAVLSGVERSAGVGLGSLAYVLLPSTWSVIADPLSYDFRDDFMGASLDTGSTWTRAQSTVGNVEINTDFGWCKLLGNDNWGANGLFSQSSIARAAGKVFLCDVYVGNGTTPNLVVGWHDGAGQLDSDFAHGVDFTFSGSKAIQVFENGNNRGSVGSGWTAYCLYRVRITLGASSAAYAIQGGPEYAAIGSDSWNDITPGTTSSTTTPLHAGATIHSAVTTYVGDIRIY
jgi:hypothetical protein